MTILGEKTRELKVNWKQLSRGAVSKFPITSNALSLHRGLRTILVSDLLGTVLIHANAMQLTSKALLEMVEGDVSGAEELPKQKKDAQISIGKAIEILQIIESIRKGRGKIDNPKQQIPSPLPITPIKRLVDPSSVSPQTVKELPEKTFSQDSFLQLVNLWNRDRPVSEDSMVPLLSQEFHKIAGKVLSPNKKGKPRILTNDLGQLASEMYSQYQKILPLSQPASLSDIDCDKPFLPHFICRMDVNIAYKQIKGAKGGGFSEEEKGGLVQKLSDMGFAKVIVQALLNEEINRFVSRRLVAALLRELNPNYTITLPEIPPLISPSEFLKELHLS